MGRFKKGAEAAAGFVKEVGNAGNKLFTSKHEKLQELNQSIEANTEDRKNAREMYKSDASLQKGFALTFLIIYILVIAIMVGAIVYFASKDVKAPDWAIVFFTTIFTGISMKVGTITDFLFGGSKTAEIQDRKKRR